MGFLMRLWRQAAAVREMPRILLTTEVDGRSGESDGIVGDI